ncbi:MAG: 3-phosphoshikimate 1-carboxyvinyltransferase [Betaproteobacteria bacterium]
MRVAEGVVTLPGSKSISNRTLLLAALAHGTTTLVDVLAADDTQRMLDALRALGVAVLAEPSGHETRVCGVEGAFPIRAGNLFLGNAGTAFRPLTAALAILGGTYQLSGVPRMHERPIGDLVDALRALGCDIRYLANEGFPPLAIGTAGGQAGASVKIRGDVSSQFLSALLMALPLAQGSAHRETTVNVIGELISRPYVGITTNLMRRFGVTVDTTDDTTFVVPAGAHYTSPGLLSVEGDASSASYFLAAGAVAGGPVRVTGVGRDSIQGDVRFADVLESLGAEMGFGPDWIEARAGRRFGGGTIDCVAIPDAAMTLAMTALFADAPTTLTNIGSWRVKETDRIAAMATELTKLGVVVSCGEDWLRVVPPSSVAPLRAATIDTYDDHRMAMCFSLASLAGVEVTINDPDCVGKTYPGYFDAFARISK